MPVRVCVHPNCGEVVRAGSYCPRHQPVRDTPGRGGGAAAARFRAEVLRAAGGRCEVEVDGVRCTATLGVEAHHVVPLAQGGSNDARSNGRALCRRHHRLIDAHVRAGRVHRPRT